MSDKAPRANPDYTKSAERLTNPPEVKVLLDKLATRLQEAGKANAEWQAVRVASPIYVAYQKAATTVSDVTEELRSAIDAHGGYQDVEKGEYALKSISYSTVYDIAGVKQHIPEFADKIIEEVVSAKKIVGLLRGGLIEQAQVDLCSEKKKKAATYVIKVV